MPWIKLALLALVLAVPSTLAAQAREFRLGIVSQKRAEKKVKGFVPLAEFVAAHLKGEGVTAGRLVVTNDVEEMILKIRRKEVDVVLESAYSTIKMREQVGMKPALLVWKHGLKDYRTIFLVRKDSGINSLKELKGKVLALQDPGSTTGYLLPVTELKRQGLQVAPLNVKAPAGAVRYVFTEHERNQIFWVLEKRAAAAAIGSDDWGEVPEPARLALKTIHTTQPVLRYVASFHPDLPTGLSNSIAVVLEHMNGSAEGRAVLEQATNIERMTPLSEADVRSLEYVRQLIKRL